MRRDLLLREFANGGTHLFERLVERRLVATATRRHFAADRPEHGFVGGGAELLAQRGGEGGVERFVAEAEIVERGREARDEARDQLGRAGRRRGFEPRVAAAFALHALRGGEEFARGACFGRRVRDAFGEHLVRVDRGALLGDLARPAECSGE